MAQAYKTSSAPWVAVPPDQSESDHWTVMQEFNEGQKIAEINPLSEAEANAHLMATAPELSDVLCDVYNEFIEILSESDDLQDLFHTIQAVLKKARGE